MSPHEKEREQEDAHPKTESYPTPSLPFVSGYSCITYFSSNAQWVKLGIKKNKDVGMGLNDILSLGGRLLVPFL